MFRQHSLQLGLRCDVCLISLKLFNLLLLVGCRKSFDRFGGVGWISGAHPPRQAAGGCGASALSTLHPIRTYQNLCGDPLESLEEV